METKQASLTETLTEERVRRVGEKIAGLPTGDEFTQKVEEDLWQKFIGDDVRKVVMAEASVAEQHDLDDKINSGQDDVQQGLRAIIKEQKDIYSLMKDKIGDGRDVEDLAPALGQLLRDQGQSFERLLKSYTALKERTTVVLSINESPEWSKLQEVLFVVFEQHPDAFDMFRSLVQERRLRLE